MEVGPYSWNSAADSSGRRRSRNVITINGVGSSMYQSEGSQQNYERVASGASCPPGLAMARGVTRTGQGARLTTPIATLPSATRGNSVTTAGIRRDERGGKGSREVGDSAGDIRTAHHDCGRGDALADEAFSDRLDDLVRMSRALDIERMRDQDDANRETQGLRPVGDGRYVGFGSVGAVDADHEMLDVRRPVGGAVTADEQHWGLGRATTSSVTLPRTAQRAPLRPCDVMHTMDSGCDRETLAIVDAAGCSSTSRTSVAIPLCVFATPSRYAASPSTPPSQYVDMTIMSARIRLAISRATGSARAANSDPSSGTMIVRGVAISHTPVGNVSGGSPRSHIAVRSRGSSARVRSR